MCSDPDEERCCKLHFVKSSQCGFWQCCPCPYAGWQWELAVRSYQTSCSSSGTVLPVLPEKEWKQKCREQGILNVCFSMRLQYMLFFPTEKLCLTLCKGMFPCLSVSTWKGWALVLRNESPAGWLLCAHLCFLDWLLRWQHLVFELKCLLLPQPLKLVKQTALCYAILFWFLITVCGFALSVTRWDIRGEEAGILMRSEKPRKQWRPIYSNSNDHQFRCHYFIDTSFSLGKWVFMKLLKLEGVSC